MKVDRLLGRNHSVARHGLGRGWLRKPRRCLVAELISPRNRTPASRRAPASLHWSELSGSLAISATFKLPSFKSVSADALFGIQDCKTATEIPLHPVGRPRLQKPPKTDNAARYYQTCFSLQGWSDLFVIDNIDDAPEPLDSEASLLSLPLQRLLCLGLQQQLNSSNEIWQ